MSSILEGADRAYLREYNESEDERRLGALKSALSSVQQETKNAGYIQNGLVLDIQLAVRRIYEDLGMDVSDGSPYDKAEDAVRKATSDLESAIFSLDEQIKLEIREVNNSIDDARMDAEEIDEAGTNCWKGYEKKGTKKMFGKTVNNCVKKESADFVQKSIANAKPNDKLAKDVESAMSEGMYDEEAFDAIFKDRKNKGSMEKPNSKPKDTGMYNQPTKRSPKYYDKKADDNKRKSGMGEVMEMYDDVSYLVYIDGKLAMPTPIEKKHMKKYESAIKNSLPGADIQFKAVAKGNYSAEELAEGNGNIRKAIAGIILIGGLLGLENHQAQKLYDKSHQLQQLTQVYMVAKERGDEAKMKDVKRRIGNHKTRLDIGKGDVDFDGLPGNDDIKDIDYINPIEER